MEMRKRERRAIFHEEEVAWVDFGSGCRNGDEYSSGAGSVCSADGRNLIQSECGDDYARVDVSKVDGGILDGN